VILEIHYPYNPLNWSVNAYGILKNNTDMPGSDISNSVVSSFMTCVNNCLNYPNCTHIGYYYILISSSPAGTCFLKKNSVTYVSGTVVTYNGVVSAVLNQSKIIFSVSNYFYHEYY
jgi:hypothetical protein